MVQDQTSSEPVALGSEGRGRGRAPGTAEPGLPDASVELAELRSKSAALCRSQAVVELTEAKRRNAEFEGKVNAIGRRP